MVEPDSLAPNFSCDFFILFYSLKKKMPLTIDPLVWSPSCFLYMQNAFVCDGIRETAHRLTTRGWGGGDRRDSYFHHLRSHAHFLWLKCVCFSCRGFICPQLYANNLYSLFSFLKQIQQEENAGMWTCGGVYCIRDLLHDCT